METMGTSSLIFRRFIAFVLLGIALTSVSCSSGEEGSKSDNSTTGGSLPSPFTISPTSANLVTGENLQFTAAGGAGSPYFYSIQSGSGLIDSSGLFTASGVPGTVTIKIADSAGVFQTATITVAPPLNISPSSINLGHGGSQSFSASGGVPPYTFTHSGVGSLVNDDYSAGFTNGTATITVTDSALPNPHSASATVNVSNTLNINPQSLNILVNSSVTFSGVGGTPPYTFSRVSGSGSLDDENGNPCISGCMGDYTSSGNSGTDIIRVTDSLGAVRDASVTVYNQLTISPTSRSIAAGSSILFSANGGIAPLSFSIAAGLGSINSSTGSFTASSTSGNVIVRVTDSIGNQADATVTVVSNLSISPLSAVISTNSVFNFSALLGTPPYSFSVASGSGSIDSATGDFTASSSPGNSIVRVTDSSGGVSNASVSIVAPMKIVSNESNTCVLFSNNKIRCWGDGAYGQLGTGNTADTGDAASEMGNNNIFIDLGTDKTALDIALGQYHACALLNDYTVKCWGRNDKGQLGLGTITNVGSSPNQMGDLLPVVNLGSGKTAKAIAAGGSSTCAILNDDSLKCWGQNGTGNLGLGDKNNRGDNSGEMGDALPIVDLGTGRKVKAVALSGNTNNESSTCAILDNDDLKCWGGNSYGQLGKGHSSDLGDSANEMGDNLSAVNLGSNLKAKKIVAGRNSFCALIKDGNSGSPNENRVKCWGRNDRSQLGLDIANNASRGDNANEMGDQLPFVNLGNTVLQIEAGFRNACALLVNYTVKCWGENSSGQAGQGNTIQYGSNSNPMSSLPGPVQLGSDFIPAQISVGRAFACALSSANSGLQIKCWGSKANGALGSEDLGSGSSVNLGDQGGEMGDQLPQVKY